MKRKSTDFDKWFEQQFGKPPKEDEQTLKKKRTELLSALDRIERDLEKRHRLWVEYRAACYTKMYVQDQQKIKALNTEAEGVSDGKRRHSTRNKSSLVS